MFTVRSPYQKRDFHAVNMSYEVYDRIPYDIPSECIFLQMNLIWEYFHIFYFTSNHSSCVGPGTP